MKTYLSKMAKTFALVLLTILSLPGAVYSQCSQLVWQDEFNGTSLDLTKWSYQTGTGTNDNLPAGWGNGELEYYTSRKQNVNVTGGNLEIIALYEQNYLGTGVNYTSGRIRSTNPITNNPRNEWMYGSFEARIKVPEPFADSRAWPGFWMLPHNGPWPNTGEIDIMETGNDNNPWYYNGTLHYGTAYPGFTSGTGGVTVNTLSSCPAANNGDLSVCFHLYRVDWSPNSIKFFVDNVQIGAVQNSSTVGSGGPIGTNWVFDNYNPFHIIFNMAVGGYFPGSAVNNSRFPLKMQVDYVRVYSTPAAVKITGKTKILQGQTGITYNVSSASGNTYNWTVPTGATITAGQGTNQITVDYGASAASGNVSVTITPTTGGCTASTNSLPVSVLPNSCTITLENFETSNPPTRNLGFNFSTGWLNRTNTTSPSFPYGTFANPSQTGVNTSANVGKYERNAGATYDVLAYNDIVIGNADDFKNGIVKFNMDVYSNAPAGTQIMVQLENAVNAQTGWPNGIHSRYTATTGAPNTWSTLQFSLLDTPDAYMPATSVDQLVILCNPNTNTNNTYYYDNFKRVGVTPTTSAITGAATVCQNNSGVIYSVTGLTGSTFNWTVPTGASIVSGQGTNKVTVNFGTTSGNVTVTETSAAKCVGTAKSLAVTVTGTCVLNADFSASKTNTCAGGVIVFTDLTSGKTGGETYSWDFGPGASLPAGTTGSGPFNVTYSTGGTKTVVLTVSRSGSTNTNTKTNYITIAAAPTGCLFNDDYNNSTVNWIAPIPGAFSHTEAGTVWTVSNSGYGEWENFTYTLNNGSTAAPLNFSCASNAPVIKIRAKASANALMRIQLMDGNGLATDNVPGFNLELTTTYQTFTINYANYLSNSYSPTPGKLDSANITKLQFFINPGYVSYPYAGTNKTYNTAFTGTVDIDWVGIGNNCNFPGTAPTITSFTPTCGTVGSTVTITGTNLTGATNVSFNGLNGTITSNTATQIAATVPSGSSSGKISITTAGGTVISTSNFNLIPTTSAITGVVSPCANATNIPYSVTATAGSTYSWALPPGATIAGGAGTNAITVNFATSSGNITVTETNAGGCVGTAKTIAITLNTAPAKPGTITGAATPCAGTATNYTIAAVSGATSYAWTLPSGWTGTSTSTTISSTPSASSGNISVTATNSCGTSAGTTLTVIPNSIPAIPGAITGSITPCQNTLSNYSISAVAGANSYNWTLPSGWTGSSTTTTIGATPNATSGTISVTATNACGTSSAANLSVTTGTIPPTPGTITGSATPCQGTSVSFTTAPVSGATSYVWTLPSGWSGTSTTNAISTTPNLTAGTIKVAASNACGTSAIASLAVTPSSIPATPGAITGSSSACQGTATSYSIAAVSGATSYAWTMPSGWTGTSTTTSISPVPSLSSGFVSVTASNTCGTSTASSLSVTTLTKPSTPVAITGSSAPCQGTSSTYSTSPVSGATSYIWTMPAGWTGSSTTNSISITAGSTSGNITVAASNSCGTSTTSSLAVTPGAAPAAPGTITGSATPCQGSATTYSITPLAGASSYTWTLPSGWTGTSTTSSISVTPNGTAGTISVNATYACGTSSASTLAVTPNLIPGTPGTITGSASPCQGTATTYSVTTVSGASSYTWTVPSGWTGTSSTTSLSTTPNATSGTITVTASNSCGTSAASSLAVTPLNKPLTPGTITGSATPCQGTTNTYSISTVAGAASYIWTMPSGWTGTSSTASISITAGATSGNITVAASNSCGTSTASTMAVTPSAAPAVPGTITGSATPCQGTATSYSITPLSGALSYTWTLPSGWTGTSTTTSITATPSATSGNISVTATYACGTSATSSKAVTPNLLPANPGSIAGSIAPCVGSAATYSIAAVANANSYTWTTPSGWTGTSTSTSLTTTPTTTSGTVSVVASNGCGTSSATNVNVTPKSLPSTGLISGASSVCINSNGNIFSVVNTAGSTYNWIVPTGATIASGTTSNSITVSFGTTGGNIAVTETNSSGCVGTQVVKSVTVTPKPNTSAISGSATPSCSATGIVYTVTPTANSTYNWTVPAGAVITSGGTTNSITVTFGTNNGSISVTETNATGCIGDTKTLAITLNGCSLTANFSGSPLTICTGETVTFTNTSTGTSASSTYLWDFGSGATPATASTAGPHTVTYSTAGAKTISLQVIEGVTKTTTKTNYITVNASPTIANAGADQSISSTSTNLAGNSPTVGVGTWTLVSGTGTIASANNPQTQITGLSVGANTFLWTITNLTCSSANQVVINVSGGSIGSISGPAQVEVNKTYTFSVAGTGSFTWTVPVGATIQSGQGTNTITVVFTTVGDGTISVGNGVSSESMNVSVLNATGVTSNKTLSYSLSPNPFQEESLLKMNYSSSSKMQIKIIDMHGIIVYQSDEYTLNDDVLLGKELASGIYTVIVYYEDTVTPIKLIKTK